MHLSTGIGAGKAPMNATALLIALYHSWRRFTSQRFGGG
jgi:hypothetical protein